MRCIPEHVLRRLISPNAQLQRWQVSTVRCKSLLSPPISLENRKVKGRFSAYAIDFQSIGGMAKISCEVLKNRRKTTWCS